MQRASRILSFAAVMLVIAPANLQRAEALPFPADYCAEMPLTQAISAMTVEPTQSRFAMMRMEQETGLTPAASVIASAVLPRTATSSHCAPDKAVLFPTDQGIMSAQAEQTLPPLNRPDVFGSVAVPVSQTPLDLKWQSASHSRLAKQAGPWASLLILLAGQDRAEQLQAVNQWVNARLRFTDDRTNRPGSDRWSGASETLRRRRGDCEDYAIAKMALLEATGVKRQDMYLVVVDDLVRRADHALLIVRLGPKFFVLDSSTDQMLDARSVTDYRPIFSFGAEGKWIHGYADTAAEMTALPAISPSPAVVIHRRTPAVHDWHVEAKSYSNVIGNYAQTTLSSLTPLIR